MNIPNTKHQEVVRNPGAEITIFLKRKKCKPFIAPFDVRLPIKNRRKDHEITTVVQPDICVICDESKIDDKGKFSGGTMYAGKEKIESKAVPGLIIDTEEMFTK